MTTTDPAHTYLGLDYGLRRIGLAVGDSSRRLAFAVGTHQEGRDGSILEFLDHLIRERDVRTLVVGLPLKADGGEGDMARKVRRFADLLAERLGLPVVLWDERYSSQEADRWLRDKRRVGKGDRDALAAEIILQSYLDSLEEGA
ncbi:Holliday junction resolvase RuvX [bacterium DOLJORAL78_65_58]|nr:MAG: Holliday junction resolvase RuvX [bacterium DOLZORAL124_64_63]PIE76312.1 MAG: Holliday junction resolvase RuvX [bacterium DOLJORAL78_65_58]